jgi:hypothetical protein
VRIGSARALIVTLLSRPRSRSGSLGECETRCSPPKLLASCCVGWYGAKHNFVNLARDSHVYRVPMVNRDSVAPLQTLVLAPAESAKMRVAQPQ